MIKFKISAKSTRNSSLGYTRPQELADLRFGPSLAVFTIDQIASDLGGYDAYLDAYLVCSLLAVRLL